MITTELGNTKFFFNPLKSRLLILFVVAHLFLAMLIGNVFAFAPDEGGYLYNFSNLYNPGFRSPSLVGWQQCPIFLLRLIYAPASIAHLLGVPGYLAIRLLAILTSTGAFYLLVCTWRALGSQSRQIRKDLLVLGSIPSLFLWMTLGLRESFIFLAFSLICAGMFLTNTGKLRKGTFLEFFGFWLLLNVKSYLFILAVLAIVVQLALQRISQRKRVDLRTYLLLLAIVLPMLIYPPSAKSMGEGVWNSLKPGYSSLVFENRPVPTLVPTTSGSTGGAPKPIVADPGVTLSALSTDLKAHPKSLLSKVLDLMGLTKIIQEHLDSIATPAGTSSVSTASRMNISKAHLRDPVGIIKNSVKFLLLPIPFYQNGSLFLNLVSFEAPFWWFLYFSFGVAVWRLVRRRHFDQLGIFVISFTCLFVVFSALTEVNVGTLIRHRSVLVIPILFFMIAQPKHKLQIK